MRWSQTTIPTLRETAADAGAGPLRLLARAGYLRPLEGGATALLPLGRRVISKMERILFRALDAAGGEPITLPGEPAAMLPDVVRSVVTSPRHLPRLYYQAGPAESSVFCLAPDAAALESQLATVEAAFASVLEACSLDAFPVDSGPNGARWLAMADTSGRDQVLTGDGPAVSAAMAPAPPLPPALPDPDDCPPPEAFATPGQHTIADIEDFAGVPADRQIKSLVVRYTEGLAMLLLRGDHEASLAKASALLGSEAAPASASAILEALGSPPGSLGPVGVSRLRVLADLSLQNRRDLTCGANSEGYHLRHVTPGRDFQPEWADLRLASPGEDTSAGRSLHFTAVRRLAVLNPLPPENGVFLAACALPLEGLLRAAATHHSDAAGLRLPSAIAPFDLLITLVQPADAVQAKAAERLYDLCKSAGLDPLLDDREERPGVKFKDADLIGIPYRATVGRRAAEGITEFRIRATGDTRELPLAEVLAAIAMAR